MEKQNKIGDWKTVEAEINRSKIKRYNWKALLGQSLSSYIAANKAIGLNAAQIYEQIRKLTFYNLTEEADRRLKISLSARFGEINAHTAAAKKAVSFSAASE